MYEPMEEVVRYRCPTCGTVWRGYDLTPVWGEKAAGCSAPMERVPNRIDDKEGAVS